MTSIETNVLAQLILMVSSQGVFLRDLDPLLPSSSAGSSLVDSSVTDSGETTANDEFADCCAKLQAPALCLFEITPRRPAIKSKKPIRIMALMCANDLLTT